jgi:hypothetical protein
MLPVPHVAESMSCRGVRSIGRYAIEAVYSGSIDFLASMDGDHGLTVSQTVGPGGVFRRGETNEDGTLDLSDGVRVLNYLFTGTATLSCLKAGDANDSGVLDLSDGVYLLSYLFLGGPAPPAPFPACGTDPTGDELGCASYESCP